MSKLAEFRAAEKQLQEQLAALEAMKGDSALQREIEFEQKLRDLLAEYGFSLRNIIALLDPGAVAKRGQAAASTAKKSPAKSVKSRFTVTRTLVKSSKPRAAITRS